MANRGVHQTAYNGHIGVQSNHSQPRQFIHSNCGQGSGYPPTRANVMNQVAPHLSQPMNSNQNIPTAGIPRLPGQDQIHPNHMHPNAQVR